MVNGPRLPGPSDPEEFPQVEPTELHPTSNIRFVMWEVARLTERVDALSGTVTKLAEALERNADRQAIAARDHADRHASALSESADRQSAALKDAMSSHTSDMKERIADAKKSVDEIKSDLKEAKGDLIEVDKKVAFVKGAMWVMGGLFALAIVLLTAFARKWIG